MLAIDTRFTADEALCLIRLVAAGQSLERNEDNRDESGTHPGQTLRRGVTAAGRSRSYCHLDGSLRCGSTSVGLSVPNTDGCGLRMTPVSTVLPPNDRGESR
jgi:hypothetical protein